MSTVGGHGCGKNGEVSRVRSELDLSVIVFRKECVYNDECRVVSCRKTMLNYGGGCVIE